MTSKQRETSCSFLVKA